MPKLSVGETFTVALILGIEKVWIRVGEYQDVLSKNFCPTVWRNFLGESFTVALSAGSEKVWTGGGSIKIFRRKFYVSQCRKNP